MTLDNLVIPKEAWPYLLAQKGSIAHEQGEEWVEAYKARLLALYENIAPWLPEPSVDCVDIGGGMSGISILLDRHYNRGNYTKKIDHTPRYDFTVCVLDGNTGPSMRLHSEPFSSGVIAVEFLRANSVHEACALEPKQAVIIEGKRWGEYNPSDMMFNLVLSFGAWCFHLPPDDYLQWLLEATDIEPEPVRMIVEVRRDKPAWRSILEDYFAEVAVIAESKKWQRIVYDRR